MAFRSIIMKRFLLVLSFSMLLCQCNNSVEKIEYYDDGKMKSVTTYVGKVKQGSQKKYYKNGNMESVGNFSNNQLEGTYDKYFENGILSERVNFVNGKKNGSFYIFYKNGSIESRGYYSNDLRQGKLITYYPDDSTKMKQEGYIIQAEGQEFLYYLKSYDRSGAVIDDVRTLKTFFVERGDSIDFKLEYVDNAIYDSMKIILGFGKNFSLNKQNKIIDTVRFENNLITKTYPSSDFKENKILGKFLGYRTETIPPDTVVVSTTVGYFEESIY